MRMQNHLKTKEMSRQKVSMESNLTERGLKEKSCENKRMQETWCQEKTVSREWGVKSRECQEKKVPRKRDAKQ